MYIERNNFLVASPVSFVNTAKHALTVTDASEEMITGVSVTSSKVTLLLFKIASRVSNLYGGWILTGIMVLDNKLTAPDYLLH
jgi:hypothetical protein